MRKTIKYLQEVEKLRFQDVGKVKKIQSSKVENHEIMFVDDRKSKGNVTLEDLDDEEMENKKEVDPEILDIFDKPLEEPKTKTVSKKRKFESSEKVVKEKNPHLEEFIESAKNSSKYKMTGIQDTSGIDVSQGIVSLATETGSSSKKKVKAHHLKDAQEESKLEKEEKDSKLFKKGGKRKRKIKI
jgi:hypothetical protein